MNIRRTNRIATCLLVVVYALTLATKAVAEQRPVRMCRCATVGEQTGLPVKEDNVRVIPRNAFPCKKRGPSKTNAFPCPTKLETYRRRNLRILQDGIPTTSPTGLPIAVEKSAPTYSGLREGEPERAYKPKKQLPPTVSPRPTSVPTQPLPTTSPTQGTTKPTDAPTAKTQYSTRGSTRQPRTARPSTGPNTTKPTSVPTVSPTEDPLAPTRIPGGVTFVEKTATPTASIVMQPTTHLPTRQPTAKRTKVPTVSPTADPRPPTRDPSSVTFAEKTESPTVSIGARPPIFFGGGVLTRAPVPSRPPTTFGDGVLTRAPVPSRPPTTFGGGTLTRAPVAVEPQPAPFLISGLTRVPSRAPVAPTPTPTAQLIPERKVTPQPTWSKPVVVNGPGGGDDDDDDDFIFTSTPTSAIVEGTEEPTSSPTAPPIVTSTPTPAMVQTTDKPTYFLTPNPTDSPSNLATVGPIARPTQSKPVVVNGPDGDEDDEDGDFIVTPAPTAAILEESEEPTPAPTRGPTESPLVRRTASPTKEHTRQPTKIPTHSPTETPTERPSAIPSLSLFPTVAPTKKPTPVPARTPSASPTGIDESNSPSPVPTTFSPTTSPATQPPTRAPSPEVHLSDDEGTMEPTVASSLFPTPSMSYTFYPTTTAWPTSSAWPTSTNFPTSSGMSWEQIDVEYLYQTSNDEAFGSSLSLSEDGGILTVGAFLNSEIVEGGGRVVRYDLSNDGGSEEVYGGELAYFGSQVATSGDGNRLVTLDSNTGIFDLLQFSPATSSFDLVDSVNPDIFPGGADFVLSGDGNWLGIVGEDFDESTSETSVLVFLYEFNENSKTFQQFRQPVEFGTNESDNWSSFDISINFDGKFIAVSQVGQDDFPGEIHVYERLPSGLALKGDAFTSERANDGFGQDVEILLTPNDDLILGFSVPYEDTVFVYTFDDNEWVLRGSPIIANDVLLNGTNSEFGFNIAFGDDGDKLIIGAPAYSNAAGAVQGLRYMQGDRGMDWSVMGVTLGGWEGSSFGEVVACNSNCSMLVVSAPLDCLDESTCGGSVYVFRDTSMPE